MACAFAACAHADHPASAQEFTGTANGFGGPVTVTISVENGAITACAISAESETPSIGGQAAKALESTIAENGTVEAVSGATMTSNAVSAALMDAMQQAGLVEQTAAGHLYRQRARLQLHRQDHC